MEFDPQINRMTTQAKLRNATHVDFSDRANQSWAAIGGPGIAAHAFRVGRHGRKALQSRPLCQSEQEFHDLGNSPLAHPEKRC
ncbi:hypothetical protein [Sphingobium sp. B2]|uniref:hypothetical protein n=1 Tax=Sphingobium sp. B2 TaxID=2583228 RepID=UPI001643E0CF|nr:hypothetical protein [Sphingobium sp. B2]